MLFRVRFTIGNAQINRRELEPFSFLQDVPVAKNIFTNLDVFHVNEIGIS